MKTVLIAGIGNVLLGDDGIGPYVVRLLESRYTFSNVEIADLGTPSLDLTHRIAGRKAVIFVDCVATDEPAGTIILYRKEELRLKVPAQRLDPHSPALSECLTTAEMLGAGPEHVLLVGVAGGNYEPGCQLSEAVRQSAGNAVAAVISELERLDVDYRELLSPAEPHIWWSEYSSA